MSKTTTGNKTTTARLILLPSIVSICWMLEMIGIIKHGQRNNFVGRNCITRSCWKDFEKDGIVLDHAIRFILFFSFLFFSYLNLILIGSIGLMWKAAFLYSKWSPVKYVPQGSILCHLLLFMCIMTSLLCLHFTKPHTYADGHWFIKNCIRMDSWSSVMYKTRII